MSWRRTAFPLSRRLGFHLRAVGFSPLPEKLATGGEDAYLSTSGVQSVLDGVSWWRDNLLVDAGLFSAALAKHMYDYVEDDLLGDLPASSFRLLQRGYELTKHGNILGTTTAMVAMLRSPNPRLQERDGYRLGTPRGADGEGPDATAPPPPLSSLPSSSTVLDVAYVGDCSLLVIRNGKILYETEEQHHDVDFPFQLGDGSADTPRDGVRLLLPVRRGDIVLMGTDGVFDNVYAHRICEMMWEALGSTAYLKAFQATGDGRGSPTGEDLDAALRALNVGVEKVVAEAINISQDIRADSPYATRCIENGINFEGGKPDDITLLAAVIEDDELASESLERLSDGLFPPPYRDWP